MNTKGRFLTVGAVSLLTAALSGCGSNWQNARESYIRAGVWGNKDANVPAWVKGDMPDEPGRIYFVGRGIGVNVLDERGAYDDARNHVMRQLAQEIATWVTSGKTESDSRRFGGGSDFLPGERATQKDQWWLKECTQAMAGDLVDRGTYWEQWYIEQEPEAFFGASSQRMKRYKCWVLMSIDREAFESRVRGTLNSIAMTSSGPNRMYLVTATQSGLPVAERINPSGATILYKTCTVKK